MNLSMLGTRTEAKTPFRLTQAHPRWLDNVAGVAIKGIGWIFMLVTLNMVLPRLLSPFQQIVNLIVQLIGWAHARSYASPY
ncbi:hypothetical protein H1R20_g7189, partial [Candolleomyces eurysporus]